MSWSSVPTQTTTRPGHAARFASLRLFLVLLLLIGLIENSGCKRKSNPDALQPSTSTSSDSSRIDLGDKNSDSSSKAGATPGERSGSSRPPLRIWLCDCESLTVPIQRQWNASSEQELDIVSISASEILERDKCDADVIVFPSRLIGEVINRKWIAKLPASVLDGDAISDNRTEDDIRGDASWPSVFKQQVAFGQQFWGVPLGAPLPVFIFQSTSDSSPNNSIHLPAAWRDIPNLSQQDNASVTAKMTLSAYRNLASRFLAFSSQWQTKEVGYGQLFEFESMTPRIAAPEFVAALESFVQHYSGAAQQAVLPLDEAYVELLNDRATWAIGWKPAAEQILNSAEKPSLASVDSDAKESIVAWSDERLITSSIPISDLMSNNDSSASEKSNSPQSSNLVTTPPKSWMSGDGLIASLGTNSRQTAVSTYFLSWLDGRTQRAALSKWSSGIQTTQIGQRGTNRPVNQDREPAGADNETLVIGQLQPGTYAETWKKLAEESNQIPFEPRMNGADEYLLILGKSIYPALQGDTTASSALDECASQWDELTVQKGRKNQVQSYKQSLNLSR